MIEAKINEILIDIPTDPVEISLDKGLVIHSLWTSEEHDNVTKKEIL